MFSPRGGPFSLEVLSTSIALMGIIPLLLLGLAIPYAVLSLRDSRELERDPQVGWKSILYFIFSLSILQMLVALTIVLIDLLSGTNSVGKQSGDLLNPTLRTGLGILLAGGLFFFVHLFLIIFASNARRFPAARRVFLGARLAVHSLVVLIAFTALIVQFIDIEHIQAEALKTPFGTLVIWIPSWVAHLALLRTAPHNASRRPGAAPQIEAAEE
jgi:hypothetical protein